MSKMSDRRHGHDQGRAGQGRAGQDRTAQNRVRQHIAEYSSQQRAGHDSADHQQNGIDGKGSAGPETRRARHISSQKGQLATEGQATNA